MESLALSYPLSMSRNIFLLLLSGWFVACSNDSKAQSQAAHQTSPVPPASSQTKQPFVPSAANEEKVKHIDGADPGQERFKLAIRAPEARVGVPDFVQIEVIPQAPWHMNLDFPTSLQMDPPEGVILAKAAQKKSDALQLNDDGAAFKVEFTAQNPGEKRFTGEFKFAVCQDEACAPVTEQVEFKVAVK